MSQVRNAPTDDVYGRMTRLAARATAEPGAALAADGGQQGLAAGEELGLALAGEGVGLGGGGHVLLVLDDRQPLAAPADHPADMATDAAIADQHHARIARRRSGGVRRFGIGRIVGAEALADVSPVQAKADKAWAMRLKLRVVPHPRLSESQRQVVSAEYMNGNPHVDLETRAATVHYLLQDARIAIDAERERPPEYQLCVEKPEEITAWLFGNETGKAAAGRTGRNRLR